MLTAQFERFVQPARSHAQIWRLVIGVLVIAIVYFVSVAFVFATIWAFSGVSGIRFWAAKVVEASTPTGTMLLLSSFAGLALAPMVAVRLLHRRRAATLFGPRAVLIRDFALTAGTVMLIYAAFTIGWLFLYDPVPNLDMSIWLTFLPIALLGILVQTGAEELVFRGYLQQQLAARFRSPIVWMLLPSVAFGLVHYDPATAGGNVWYVVGSATAFGILAADLVRTTGSIGAAWGFHFANNVLAVLIIAVDGTLPGLALYLTPYSADDTTQLQALILVDFSALIIAWVVLRRVLRR